MFNLALSMLAAQRCGMCPMAQIPRLSAFAGIPVLAMVHQVMAPFFDAVRSWPETATAIAARG